MSDDTLYHLAKLSEARAERDELRAEVTRLQERINELVRSLNGLLDDFARPGDPQIDLTTFVIDTQTRVPVEPRHE